MKFSKLALATVAAFGLAGVAQADGTYYVQENLELWGTLGGQTLPMPQTGANEYGNDDSNGAVWFGAATEIGDTAVLTYDGNAPTGNIPTVNGVGDVGSKYLKVSNSSTLWRVIKPYVFTTPPTSFNELVAKPADPEVPESMDVPVGGVKGAPGLFVDTLVQFTPSEDPPAAETGSKMIVWMNTNGVLCVTAGYVTYVSAFNCEPRSFETDQTLKTNTWYRLTVSAYDQAAVSGYDVVNGFTVKIDGKIATSTTAVMDSAAIAQFADDATDGWWPEPQDLAEHNQFFASLTFGDPNNTLAAVGFKGEGLVDDIIVTDTDPFAGGEPAGGIDFTLTWTDGVSAVWYAIGATTNVVDITDKSFVKVTVDDATAGETQVAYGGSTTNAWYVMGADAVATLQSDSSANSYTVTATVASNGGAAGVEGDLAGFSASELMTAFPGATPAQINQASNAYLDYQLGQGLGTFAADAEPVLDIVGIEPNATTGWDISVQVLAAANGDAVAVGNMKASLMVIRSSTLAGLATAVPVELGAVPVYDGENKVYTFTETSGQFFKAYIKYAVPANN